MSKLRWGLLAVVIIAVIAGLAGRASASLESDNGCSASGIFRETGLEVDAAAIGDTVVVIPRSDVVDWQGSVAAPPGAYSGSISVELPPPFGDVEFHSWSGDSDTVSSAGAEDYDLPWMVPAGVEFQVSGSHTDENGTCSGFVNLEIDGGPFDSLAAPISLVGTVVTGAGLLATIRPLFRRGTV